MTDMMRLILEDSKPAATRHTKDKVIKALRSGCKHALKDWHYRLDAPNPFSPGHHRSLYMFRNYVEPAPEDTCLMCGALKQHWIEDE
jgi:hypothetical protein